jgi:uncharacterized protein (TIGR03083 family)
MANLDEIYAESQERLLTAIEKAGPTGAATMVPACPDWRVRDVLAHVSGICADVVNGTLPVLNLMEQWRDESVANARDAMTAREVDDRRDLDVDTIAKEWRGLMPALGEIFRGEAEAPATPFIDSILVTDLTTHEQDVRSALGLPAVRDAAGIGVGLASFAFGVGYRLQALGLPPLRIVYGAKSRVIGDGEPAATVEADKFELFRAFSGRRSRAQIAALAWTGDPAPYLPLIPAYGERADALVE